MTLAQLRTALRKRIGNPSTEEVPDATLTEIINLSQRRVATVFPFLAARLEASFPTVASQLGYSLNSAAKVIRHVWDNTNNIRLQPKTEAYYAEHEADTGEGKPLYYVHLRDTLYLFPKPDAVYTIKYIYKTTVTDMSADGDSPITPVTWDEVLLARSKMTYYGEYKQDYNRWQLARVAYEDAVKDLPSEVAEEQSFSDVGVVIPALGDVVPKQDFDHSE